MPFLHTQEAHRRIRIKHMTRLRWRGFTAIELLTTMTILAVLLAIAAPNLMPLIQKWRVKQTVEGMYGSLYLARSEAIKRAATIRVEKIPTNGSCVASTNQDWNCGWRVYVDVNDNSEFNSNKDELIQEYSTQSGVQVTNYGGSAGFNVNRWGDINGMGAKGMIFMPASAKNTSDIAARGICVSSGGRIKTIEDPPCS